ncbi:MAG: hypothetical protein PHS14_20465 [Elusimicrobia bacterium]|nr:hypothetical protein [Elusimicrobiota bacterium]
MNDRDIALVEQESKANPAFGRKLSSILRQPGGERDLSIWARKVIANQLNPRMYPETKGEWPVLRRQTTAIAESMPSIVEKLVERMPLSEKMAAVRAIADGDTPQLVMAGLGDLGQFEIIGSLIGAAAGAASSIYGARVTASAQKDIAKIQANAAMQSASAQVAIANAQAAITQAQAKQAEQLAVAASSSSPAGFLTQDIGGGVPGWAVPAGIAGLGLFAAIFFAFKKKGRR